MSLAAAPPTGTLTFLFTDIAGSTRLWDHYPDAMRPALARHDTILRQSIEDNSGFVFKTVGDAFCAAFAFADDALQAALAAQLALQAELWDLPMPILVRMALHTGAAEERGGDYFGPPLNRVSRLLTVGHGGQSLLSEVTQGLVRDSLPGDSALRDLGAHRLKDLRRSEQVFQLLHPNLPAEFPPLRSLGNPNLPNNLPYHMTSFIGRENETLAVKTLTQASRLVTLVGSGGAGKSRLSLQVAADLLEHFPDGAWFVELAPLSDPTLVSQEVADVLEVREADGKTVQQGLMEWLMPKRLLLVLDNCEHLIGACAVLVTDLLRNCPGVHILASSRERLGVSGERVYRIPSLALPDLNQTQTLESLSQYEAVTLFLERAQAAQPSFSVTNANAPAIASVCHRLDGIPLALELAAARLRSLSVEEVNARLDNRFRLLTGGSRTALPRQQTLRALIDWSYDLLTALEKAMLCRLSVFVDGWTLEAAETVCSGGNEDCRNEDCRIEDFEVLDLLESLADKSLAAAEMGAGGTRYRFLETVRQYASDRLRESGEAEAVCRRSAGWFLDLAEKAEPHLRGPEQTSWLGRLEIEHDNLRASLLWYEHLEADNRNEQAAESAEGGLRLAGALWRFWFVRGHYSEGRQWLGRALERAKEKTKEKTKEGLEEGETASASWAKALNGAGNLADEQGDYAGARELYEESLTLQRRLGDPQGIASLLSNLGSVAAKQGDYAGARALFEESLSVFRQLESLQGVAGLLGNLGILAANQGDYAGSRAMYEESLAVFRQLGNPQGIAASLNNLANVLSEQGDYEAARALHEESLTLQRQLGNQRGIANSLGNLGTVDVVQGDFAQAKVLLEESLALNRQLGNQRGIANSLGNLGTVASGQGNPTEAQTLFGESLAYFRELGDQAGIADALNSLGNVAFALSDYAGAKEFYGESLAIQRQLGHPAGIICSLQGMAGAAHGQHRPLRAARLWGAVHALRQSIGRLSSPAEQRESDKETASVREALGDRAFSAAWEAGQEMTLEQAAQYALAVE